MHRGEDGQWTPFGSMDDRVPFDVRVTVQAGELRIYETVAVELQAGAPDDAGPQSFVYKLRVSDDRAVSWREFALASDSTPSLIGIDPLQPDSVVVLIDHAQGNDAILVSRDQGASLQPYLEVSAFGGIAWAPDGRVWIGDLGTGSNGMQGLWAAPNIDTAPARLPMANYPVQCVAYRPESNTLYVCQHFWLRAVAVDTGAFSQLLSFAEVDSFASCDGQETARSCEQQLCSAYCGEGHFAVAPVCAAYDMPSCGVPVALSDGAAWASAASDSTPAAGGGGSGSAGQAGAVVGAGGAAAPAAVGGAVGTSGPAAISGAAGAAGAAVPAAISGGGGTPSSVPTRASSGCACGVVRASAARGLRLGLAWLGVLLMLMRRRARRT